MDAANGSAGSSAKTKRRHRAAPVDAASVSALADVVALALQGVSELAAAAADVPELAFAEGLDGGKGEADVLAIMPAKWLAKTSLGKRVAKTIKDTDLLATLAVLGAYATRIAPPVIAKVQENVNNRPARQVSGPEPRPADSGKSAPSTGVPTGVPVFDPATAGLGIPVVTSPAYSPNGGSVPYPISGY
jgi:hypothetical protein